MIKFGGLINCFYEPIKGALNKKVYDQTVVSTSSSVAPPSVLFTAPGGPTQPTSIATADTTSTQGGLFTPQTPPQAMTASNFVQPQSLFSSPSLPSFSSPPPSMPYSNTSSLNQQQFNMNTSNIG